MVSEEGRRHCVLLLRSVDEWREEEVPVRGAGGQEGGRVARLVLAAASPLLRPWLAEGGDLVLLPDSPPAALGLLCRRLTSPPDRQEAACLRTAARHLGLPLPPALCCALCRAPCASLAAMEEHLAGHCNLETLFSCDDCQQAFGSLEDLSLHCAALHAEERSSGRPQLLTAAEERRFPCERCDKQFGTRVQLRHHMNIHLGLRPYACSVCDKAFTQPTHLSVHRRIHNGAKPYMCSICGKTFAIASNMRKHAAIHDRSLAELSPAAGPLPALPPCRPPDPEPRPAFPCAECGQEFAAPRLRSQHERREHQRLACTQPGCGKAWGSASQLEKHMLTHTGERPHICPVCSKTFTQKSHVTQHVATVHREPGSRPKSHVCPQCGKCFVSRGVLGKHMMLHTNQRPHKCSVCDKAFVQKSHLKVHMTQHTGDRPFTCQECGKSFTTKQHLKEHTKLHTGTKPWLSCSQCPARYRGQTDLAIHMRLHSGEAPFPCSDCAKRFRSERSLENHRRVHSGVKPFPCGQCAKRFTTPAGLRQHFKHNPRCKDAAGPGSFSSKLEDGGRGDGEGAAPAGQAWARPA